MSKKVVTKKKAPAPAAPAAPAAAATPATAAAAPQASAAQSDARVAQQRRVLETVGAASSKSEKDVKQYSPRTEGHIKQLGDVLDFFEFSRSDIAALVRRCHFDETQIQVAVANIIEDRANHAQDDWGTVKNKKQAKEEKKEKEEADRREQERLEKEAEKQRRDAERRAARESREATKRGGGKGKRGEEEEAQGTTALPPDPAILFAGQMPAEVSSPAGLDGAEEEWEDEWWDETGKWNGSGGKDWNWQKNEKWNDRDWEGAQAEDDSWWAGEWEKAGSRKKGKDKKGAQEVAAASPAAAPKKDASADMWDMPDVSAAIDAEAGLDQWTLGALPPEGETSGGMPKALPEGAMTLEELEHRHLGMPSSLAPATAAPMGAPTAAPASSPMMPPTAPPMAAPVQMSGAHLAAKHASGQDLLASIGGQVAGQPPLSPELGAADRDKGKKGKGKGKGEKDAEKERLERIDRSDDPRRQAVEEMGEYCTVRKHSSMGCAVVSMKDLRVRQVILGSSQETKIMEINGIKVQVKPNTNKETKEEIMTDIFVAWGRQVEKTTPLSERELTKFFDSKHAEIASGWKAQEEEKERQQRLQEEQARQDAALRQRTEERRRYEEEMQSQKRRQEEADQQRQQQQQQQQQQKLMTDQWMQNARAAGFAAPAAAADPSNPYAQAQAQQPQQQQQQAQQAQQAQAAVQWGAAHQWMQAMAYHSQQGWQQQMAQRNMQQMQGMAPGQGQQGWQQQMQGATAGTGQDYDSIRAQAAAYYAYMDQTRGQSAAAYSQAQAAQQAAVTQGGYQNPAAGANFSNYGAAAAAAYAAGRQGGERI